MTGISPFHGALGVRRRSGVLGDGSVRPVRVKQVQPLRPVHAGSALPRHGHHGAAQGGQDDRTRLRRPVQPSGLAAERHAELADRRQAEPVGGGREDVANQRVGGVARALGQ